MKDIQKQLLEGKRTQEASQTAETATRGLTQPDDDNDDEKMDPITTSGTKMNIRGKFKTQIEIEVFQSFFLSRMC